jgi:hypothetical protein
MATVMQRIKQIKQPRGGFIPPKTLEQAQFLDSHELNTVENLSPMVMGIMVDYLTRYAQTGSVEEAFAIPLRGLELAKTYTPEWPMVKQADDLLDKIDGFSEVSLDAATIFTTFFDTYYRVGPRVAQTLDPKAPDTATRQNMMIMVDRSITFFTAVSPLVASDLTFEGGYTETVNKGDADFMSETTLWDMKVSKNPPTKENTLQVAMYYLPAFYNQVSHYR